MHSQYGFMHVNDGTDENGMVEGDKQKVTTDSKRQEKVAERP